MHCFWKIHVSQVTEVISFKKFCWKDYYQNGDSSCKRLCDALKASVASFVECTCMLRAASQPIADCWARLKPFEMFACGNVHIFEVR